MSHRFCVAPMMDRTDRHCRYFHRSLTKRSLLYTEMLHSNAIINGKTYDLLEYNQQEHPLAIQLGGADPKSLSEAAIIAEDFGYSEINLNVGCPSSKVQKGKFGAVLMKEPQLVSSCVNEIIKSVKIPVTVKCRIGVDDMDEDAELDNFIKQVSLSGCDTFIIHARKAWLKGLSPKENREIPPLNYERVYRVKDKFPNLNIVINGGIRNMKESLHHLGYVDGVMIGRAAYENPLMLMEVDNLIFSEQNEFKSREDIIAAMIPYLDDELKKGTKANKITKHLLGLFKGLAGAKQKRKFLSSFDAKVQKTAEIENYFKKVV